VDEVFEVEIALLEGTSRDLLVFGAELSSRFPLIPEAKSKYRRGLCLAELPTAREVEGNSPWPAAPAAFLSEAVKTVMDALAAYYSTPDSTETLHDLRVALRKLRSRLSFAAPLYLVAEGRHWKEVLQSWSRHTARIRELDMLQGEWNMAAAYLGIDSSRCPLVHYLKEQRDKASAPFYKVVETGKMTAELLAFWSWALGQGTLVGSESEWGHYSLQRLSSWVKKFGKLTKEIDILDAAAMHALRIRGKKTRYMLERQSQFRGARESVRLVGKLKQLLECLGEIQDSIQGSQTISKMAQAKQNTEHVQEIGTLAGWQTRRGFDAQQRFEGEREEFRHALKRWHKAGGKKELLNIIVGAEE